MANKRAYFRVHGTVQGVSFRFFTQKKAVSYGLTGWVKNTPNGQVEGEVQGEEEKVKKILKDVDKGPTYAHVVKIETEDRDLVEGEEKFEIRH